MLKSEFGADIDWTFILRRHITHTWKKNRWKLKRRLSTVNVERLNGRTALMFGRQILRII